MKKLLTRTYCWYKFSVRIYFIAITTVTTITTIINTITTFIVIIISISINISSKIDGILAIGY